MKSANIVNTTIKTETTVKIITPAHEVEAAAREYFP